MAAEAIAPGSVVIVRDEEWLVTSTETTDGVRLLSVQGLSELVRGTSATFFDCLDDIEVADPATARLVADDSSSYRRARLWLEASDRNSIEIIANDVVARRATLGLEPLPPEQAQPLAVQALRFLYRILFLLYAEASPELGVLPVKVPEYEQGYSLDRLRELVLSEPATPRARSGTHLYASLRLLFDVVDRGRTKGLEFNPLRADLFRPRATALIDEVKLSNLALQRVLAKLLLSKESAGKARGFISYVDLGINQLGAVYEGLMSYTGFFATEDLYEVAKDGKPEKGSWVVPVQRADHLAEKDFVREEDTDTGERRPVLHRRGTFVYRLSGRERQQSASYYTPEVLTRFTVGQALEELLDQDGATTPAADILDLTVCEPALGSGAFAIEAVRQLADQYLTRRQAELEVRIPPDEYPQELQRVKAYLALHQVYGVDLNATAVELAEISLWLDTMARGLEAPWFGLHLRRGNSLIGARHAVYARAQANDKSWLSARPTDVPLRSFSDPERLDTRPDRPDTRPELVEGHRSANVIDGRIFHFLLPAAGWGATGEAKEARELAPEATEVVRRVMDAWCALWFWPLHGAQRDRASRIAPPTLDQWISALQGILGRDPQKLRRANQDTLAAASDWDELGRAEQDDLAFAQAQPIERVLHDHPWLRVCRDVAVQQGFFHWELDFATVFARGGFDLQLGNPPWVRPTTNVDALLAEGDPWWQLALRPSEGERNEMRKRTLDLPGIEDLVIAGTTEIAATAEYVGSAENFPLLKGTQPDLYRCFMCQVWSHSGPAAVSMLIHYETHFTDERAGEFRGATYRRLRRHWEFINELLLFDIEHHKHWGVSVFGRDKKSAFLQATGLYHPDTVERSLRHDGTGPEPGFKDAHGRWDLRPHRNRVVMVSPDLLRTWHDILETPDVPVERTRMVYTINRSAASVLNKLSDCPRLRNFDPKYSAGWHEKNDKAKGFLVEQWSRPSSWSDVILQGPHIYVNVPLYKHPNQSMSNNLDWSAFDLESLAPDSVPITAYQRHTARSRYDAAYTHWSGSSALAARDYYRVAWRRRAANGGERTLIPAIIPPGSTHVDYIFSLALLGESATLPLVAGGMSALLSDFSLRSAPKGDIRGGQASRLSTASLGHPLSKELIVRTLRLNCVTNAYADLWRDCFDPAFTTDAWTDDRDRPNRPALGDVAPEWTAATPLRIAADRRQAQVEIDALVALMLGVTADELCTVYRTQFAVLYGYDHDDYTYDANGRLVLNAVLKVWRAKGDRISLEERTHTNQAGNTYVYELPFGILDREADMRRAYAEFERRLATTEAGTNS